MPRLDAYLVEKVLAPFIFYWRMVLSLQSMQKNSISLFPQAQYLMVFRGGDFISFAGSVLNNAADTILSIYFEIPTIENLPIVTGHKVQVKDSTGKVIAEKDLITLNPLTDLAYFNLDQDAVSNYAQVGTRVALKHIIALASAYVIYKNTLKPNETLALIYASSAYAAASKIIEMSEEADLRSWTSLPHMYSVAEFNLKPGKYTIEYHNKGIMKTLGEVSVVNQKTAFIKQRIFESFLSKKRQRYIGLLAIKYSLN